MITGGSSDGRVVDIVPSVAVMDPDASLFSSSGVVVVARNRGLEMGIGVSTEVVDVELLTETIAGRLVVLFWGANKMGNPCIVVFGSVLLLEDFWNPNMDFWVATSGVLWDPDVDAWAARSEVHEEGLVDA